MWKTFRAVLWSFLGIRSKTGYEQDRQQIKVQHVIIAGLVSAVVFVMVLIILVKFLTAK